MDPIGILRQPEVLRIKFFPLYLFTLVFLTSCNTTLFTPYRSSSSRLDAPSHAPTDDVPIFSRVRFSDLPGYKNDSPNAILTGLLASCHSFNQIAPTQHVGTETLPLRALDWHRTCLNIKRYFKSNQILDRRFFESLFIPYRVSSKKSGKSGLFTGYYEAELQASYTQHHQYRYPIYKRPNDLKKINNKFKPYFTREQIAAGKLKGKNLELLWAKDPLDVFILHIQGSGKITLDDGTILRINYDGNNGYSYRSIAKKMISDGLISKNQADWESIRDWLTRHPHQINRIFNHNQRYIFFKINENQHSVFGAQNTPLIAKRSLATDLRYIPLGSILWVDIENIINERPNRIQRFMISQDTGNAIKGVIRGDFYWGSGNKALYYAGKMKNKGSYYILLPKTAMQRISFQSTSLVK